MSNVLDQTVQTVDQDFQVWYGKLNLLLGRRSKRMDTKSTRAGKKNDDEMAQQFKKLEQAIKEYETLAKDVKGLLDKVGTEIKNQSPQDPEHAKLWKTYVSVCTESGDAVRLAIRNEKKTKDKSTGIVTQTATEIGKHQTKLESLGVDIKNLQAEFSPEEKQRRAKQQQAKAIKDKQKIAEWDKYQDDLKQHLTEVQKELSQLHSDTRLNDDQLATQLETVLAKDTQKFKGLDDARDIIKRHRAAVPAEKAAFLGQDRLEDTLALVARITTDNNKRKAMLNAMKQAKDAALLRHRELQDALKETQKISRDALELTLTPKELDAFDQIRSFGTGMLAHIPSDYVQQATKFDDRIANLLRATDDGETDKMKREAVADLIQHRDAEAELFQKAISEHSGLDSRRFDTFFNQLTTPVPSKEMKKLEAAIDAAVKRAHKVRDAGGSVSEVEQQLAHIPRNFWPTEFVLELQGWRKVERAMLDEAVDEAAAELEKKSLWERAKSGGSNAKAFFDIALGALPPKDKDDTPPEKKFLSDEFNESLKILGSVQHATQAIEDIYSTFQDAKELKIFVEWFNDARSMPFEDFAREKGRDIKEWATTDWVGKAEKVGGYCGKIANGVGHIANYSKDVSNALGDYALPGVSLALGIKDFGIAAAKHTKRGREKTATHQLFDRAQRERATKEELAHYEGLENAFHNHERQMDRLRQGHRHEMVVAGVKMVKGGAEIAATATGIAAPAAYGVKAGLYIVEKAIVYGGKVYFANVDFNAAQRARKTLEEARAGNRIAQLQVFEDNGRYAKMLIAIMVKDEDPLAIEFIVQRGFRDRDLDKPENSAMVLRKWMMTKAEQTDERDAPETRVQANVEGVFGKTPKKVLSAMNGVKDQCQVWAADAKVKWKGHPYKPNWTPPAVQLTREAWSDAKEKAIENGLFPKDSGIGKPLGELHKRLLALGMTANFTADGLKSHIAGHTGTNFDPNPNPVPGIRKKDLIQAAMQAARDADSAMSDFDPMHVPMSEDGVKVDLSGKVDYHEPMVKYLADLRSQTNRVGNMLEALLEGVTKTPNISDYDPKGNLDPSLINTDWLVGETIRDLTWRHSSNHEALTESAWTTATDDALKKAWMDKAGGGDKAVLKLRDEVTKALKSYESAAAKAVNLTSLPGMEARKLRQAKYDALQKVIDAMKAYWKDCGHNGIRAYIDKLTSKAGTDLHDLDLALFPDAPPSIEERITACRIVLTALPKPVQDQPDRTSKKSLSQRLSDIDSRKDTDDYDNLMRELDALADDLKRVGATAKLPDSAIASLEPPTGTFSLTLVKGKPGPQHFDHVIWEKTREECVTAGVMDSDKSANAVWAGLKAWREAQDKLEQVVTITLDNAGREVHTVNYGSNDSQKEKDKKSKEAQKRRFEVRKALTNVFLSASKVATQAHTPAIRDYVNFIILHAQKLNLAALEVQGRVDFTADYHFTKSAWETSYDNAVNAGAVNPEDKRKKRLASAISSFESKHETMRKAKDRGKMRLEAARVVKLLNEVSLAANEVSRAEGYSDHKTMEKVLDNYQSEVVTRTNNNPISGLIDGEGSNAFNPGPFRYDNGAWQEVKKAAITDGIVDDRKTGFGKQLEVSDKAYVALLSAQRGNVTDAKKLAKLRNEALAQLTATEKIALALKSSSKNPKFSTYMTECQQEITKRRGDLGDTGVFKGFPFKMENNHWQSVKSVAVAAGLIADAKTGFGATLTTTSKAIENYTTEKEANHDTTQVKARLTDAIKATRDSANKLKSQVKDTNFQRYLDECLALLDQYADYAAGTQTKLLELPDFEFTEDAWKEAKKRAVAAGVLPSAKTGLQPAIKDAVEAYDKWLNETDDNKATQRVNDLNSAILTVKSSVNTAVSSTTCKSLKLFVQQFEDTVDDWTEQIDDMDNTLPGTVTKETAEWLPAQFAKPQLTEAEWKSVGKEAKKHGWAGTKLPIRKDFVALDRALKVYSDATDKTAVKTALVAAYNTVITDAGKLKDESKYSSKWDKGQSEHPGMKRFAERLVTVGIQRRDLL